MKKIFLYFDLLTIDWNPYNGGNSLRFIITFLTIGGLFPRSLFKFRYEKFCQWDKPKYELEIFFINIRKK